MDQNKGKVVFTFKDVQEGSPDYIKIVKDIPDEIIYNFYLGFYPSLNRKFKSPFKQEKDPSFCFYVKDGKVLFKCFSTGKFGDSVELVKQIYSIDYVSAIKRICRDIKSLKVNDIVPYKKLSLVDTKKSVIEVITRTFTEFDYSYWNGYYITPELLQKYDIKPCEQVWLNDKLHYTNQKNNPAYRFKIGNLYKIYCPLAKNKLSKWLSNCDLNNVQGLDYLNYNNDTLIITKSYKDIIILNEYYNKSTIALNAEGNNLPDKMLEYFRSKFKNIICFYDNDDTGIKYMVRNKELYGFEYCYFKEDLLTSNIKDPSDYIKQYGILSLDEIKEDLIFSNESIKNLI